MLSNTTANRSRHALHRHALGIILDLGPAKLPLPIVRAPPDIPDHLLVGVLCHSKPTSSLVKHCTLRLCLKVLLTPPQPHAPHPTLTVTLPSPQTELVLDLKTTSLMGSRAKLADVPKLHELITHQVRARSLYCACRSANVLFQIRRAIIDKGTWKIVLPGLGTVQEVKEDIKRERTIDSYCMYQPSLILIVVLTLRTATSLMTATKKSQVPYDQRPCIRCSVDRVISYASFAFCSIPTSVPSSSMIPLVPPSGGPPSIFRECRLNHNTHLAATRKYPINIATHMNLARTGT